MSLELTELNINVGSRKSQLALIQTKLVVKKLEQFYSNNPDELIKLYTNHRKEAPRLNGGVKLNFQITTMTTIGDRVLDKPLPAIGTKSLFTRELEIELLQERVHFVVHSLKDLPTKLPEGCVIGAILKRDDSHDAIVLKKSLRDKINPIDLLTGRKEFDVKCKIGTSSQRRIAMIRRCNPDIECIDIRGNLNTRISKLDNDDGDYTAIVLAKAGLDRMNWTDRISSLLNPMVDKDLDCWYYAVGQGAIAVECRASDKLILDLLSPIVDMKTTCEAVAERSLMRKLEGGCSVPLGVISSWSADKNDKILNLKSIVLSIDGKTCVKAEGQTVLPNMADCSTSQADTGSTTGVVTSSNIKFHDIPPHSLTKCSELGVDVAIKMTDLGCMDLINQCR